MSVVWSIQLRPPTFLPDCIFALPPFPTPDPSLHLLKAWTALSKGDGAEKKCQNKYGSSFGRKETKKDIREAQISAFLSPAFAFPREIMSICWQCTCNWYISLKGKCAIKLLALPVFIVFKSTWQDNDCPKIEYLPPFRLSLDPFPAALSLLPSYFPSSSSSSSSSSSISIWKESRAKEDGEERERRRRSPGPPPRPPPPPSPPYPAELYVGRRVGGLQAT